MKGSPASTENTGWRLQCRAITSLMSPMRLKEYKKPVAVFKLTATNMKTQLDLRVSDSWMRTYQESPCQGL